MRFLFRPRLSLVVERSTLGRPSIEVSVAIRLSVPGRFPSLLSKLTILKSGRLGRCGVRRKRLRS